MKKLDVFGYFYIAGMMLLLSFVILTPVSAFVSGILDKCGYSNNIFEKIFEFNAFIIIVAGVILTVIVGLCLIGRVFGEFFVCIWRRVVKGVNNG